MLRGVVGRISQGRQKVDCLRRGKCAAMLEKFQKREAISPVRNDKKPDRRGCVVQRCLQMRMRMVSPSRLNPCQKEGHRIRVAARQPCSIPSQWAVDKLG